MRVLFAAIPIRSNFLYLAPLAWALCTAGHEVRFASQPGFADTITQAGLTAVPVGRDRQSARQLLAAGITPTEMEQTRAELGSPYDIVLDPSAATWDRVRRDHVLLVQGWHKPTNFPIIAGLVEFARHWRPDLVIWEPLTLAGPIAAKACGAAHARMLWGVDVFGATRQHFLRIRAEQPPAERADPVAEWLAGYGRQYGFEFTEDMVTGQLTIDQFPGSLQMEAALPYLRMQYVPYAGAAVVPRWLWTPPRRPRVALTLGLSAIEAYGSYPADLADILAGLGELDIEVVANVAESEQAKLGPVPDNVRLFHFAPWHALVPTCAVVIHHAGAATLATTSLHPVPQLALHHHFDQPILARNLAAQGAGLELPASRATGANVRDSVLRLLHEPSFRDHAVRLRDEIRALPTPNQLVASLEELTAARPGSS